MKEKKCKSCILHDFKNQQCRVAVIVDGKQTHLPVFPEDDCHFIELGMEAQVVRWFKENDKMKIEYPEDFFGGV